MLIAINGCEDHSLQGVFWKFIYVMMSRPVEKKGAIEFLYTSTIFKLYFKQTNIYFFLEFQVDSQSFYADATFVVFRVRKFVRFSSQLAERLRLLVALFFIQSLLEEKYCFRQTLRLLMLKLIQGLNFKCGRFY